MARAPSPLLVLANTSLAYLLSVVARPLLPGRRYTATRDVMDLKDM
jgi:hypothetical protein